MTLYNTLSHTIEEFKPLNPLEVRMYTCGPTVYDFQHIGHMRRYVGDDILIRTLQANGYQVKQVMNITDVGHLVSDSDEGEDKMEKGARKYNLSVWDIAKKFEQQFWDSIDGVGIKRPSVLMHATDFIAEQIELIKILEEKGFAYQIEDGLYFDTSKFPDYFKLSRQNPQELQAGARVDMIAGKKHISDFALWKFSPNGEKRQMEWDSPWGKGFPGWHIECSAMSMRELGPSLDIHTGGIDHIMIHHTNEIAQSEAATGQPFVKHWVHYNFLMVEGQKMSKSLGNLFTVEDVVAKGYDPLALRYLYLQTHYRQEMNFTWEALEAAQSALNRLRSDLAKLDSTQEKSSGFDEAFLQAISDDMNTSQALARIWELVKVGRRADVLKADEILGLNLGMGEKEVSLSLLDLPEEVQNLLKEREKMRTEKRFSDADRIRDQLNQMGYSLQDNTNGDLEVKKRD